MLDSQAAILALRNHALATTVVTTGAVELSATAGGYARAAGSFLADGFAVGMEVIGQHFGLAGNNGAHIIDGVSATTLTCQGCSAESSAAGRTLAVGLPALAAWENVTLTPTTGRWFLEEEYVPGPVAGIELGPFGAVEYLPQYVLKLYGLANRSTAALYAVADAVLTQFAPRTALTLTTGDTLRVRMSPAPYRSPLIPIDGGWAVGPITIPCGARVHNSI
jgi:hypothetical protein